jgi:hypothetical protein
MKTCVRYVRSMNSRVAPAMREQTLLRTASVRMCTHLCASTATTLRPVMPMQMHSAFTQSNEKRYIRKDCVRMSQ